MSFHGLQLRAVPALAYIGVIPLGVSTVPKSVPFAVLSLYIKKVRYSSTVFSCGNKIAEKRNGQYQYWEHAVAYSVEALCYKPDGRGLDSLRGH
jgi:hypothetical protein